MDAVGVERAFGFLKQTDWEARTATERRIKRKIQDIMKGYLADAAQAVQRGEEFDYDGMADALRAAIQPELAGMVVDAGLGVSVDVGIAFDPAIINTHALQWARTYSYELIKGLTETTRRQVSEVMSAFVETPGMTEGDLEKLLEPAFGRIRADMIATTEATRAFSEATNEIQRLVNQTGLAMTRIWQTQNDELVCEICGPLNGRPEEVWAGEYPDGPPAHVRCRCGSGLTARPIEEIQAQAEELARQRDAMLFEMGRPLTAQPAIQIETIPQRIIEVSEQALLDEIAEVKAALADAQQAGRQAEADGIKSYLNGLNQSLQDEQRINQELWNKYQMSPSQASLDDWRRLATELETEGYSLYQKYAKEGIAQFVDEKRGAQESGYMIVGKEQVMVRQGAFSVRSATRMKGEMWASAKDELNAAMGELLQQAGFTSQDIAQANYEQRQRLLSEMGEMQVSRTGAGRISKIDKVPENARERVVSSTDYDQAATYAEAAIDPLNLPTLDAYGKMEAADLIRSVILGE